MKMMKTLYLKVKTFLFHEGTDWFNTSYEDSQPFEEDSILTALLLINGYLFFLHLT